MRPCKPPPEKLVLDEETVEAYVTFEMFSRDRDGHEFTVQYDSRNGFRLEGKCWNKDLSLFHEMIEACTAFTRGGR